MWTLKRITGTVFVAASAVGGTVLAVLSVGTREELFSRLGDWWTWLGGIAASILTLLTVPGVVFLVGIAVGLWAWDVPQRLTAKLRADPTDPKIVEEARKRKVRVQIGGFLRDVYSQSAASAIGTAFEQVNGIVAALRADPTDKIKLLAANLLIEHRTKANEMLHPMLNVQMCDTEEAVVAFLGAWGELFARYQSLVIYNYQALIALGVAPWSYPDYETWRRHDSKFIAAMKDAEHMEGCEQLAQWLKAARWGNEFRPPRPAALH